MEGLRDDWANSNSPESNVLPGECIGWFGNTESDCGTSVEAQRIKQHSMTAAQRFPYEKAGIQGLHKEHGRLYLSLVMWLNTNIIGNLSL